MNLSRSTGLVKLARLQWAGLFVSVGGWEGGWAGGRVGWLCSGVDVCVWWGSIAPHPPDPSPPCLSPPASLPSRLTALPRSLPPSPPPSIHPHLVSNDMSMS